MARLLIIEDDDTLRDSMVECLSGCGFDVRSAPDGEKALERLRAEDADLIILDLAMPGMDGQQFVQECRKLPRLVHVPILLSTGFTARQVQGTDARLDKPFDVHQLLEAVRLCLRAGPRPEPSDSLGA